jgi:hypothetical protein
LPIKISRGLLNISMKLRLTFFLLFICAFIFSCEDKKSNQVNFPTHIYLEKKSPDNNTTAIIYSWSVSDYFNFLGSNKRYILGFKNLKSKWYVDFELSEGFGTYEGGITELEWLNNNEVLIKRVVSDRPKDIKYNLKLNEWSLKNTSDF